MRSPKTVLVSLFAVAVVFGSIPAFAAKEISKVRAVDGVAQPKVVRGQPFSGQGTCTLGANLSPAWAIDYFLPPADKYYTLLEPAQCVSCPDTARITAAHILLQFQAACDQPIEVSIVGVSRDDPSCVTPDSSNVIMPPVPFLLDGSTINTTIDFTMPLPQTVCVTDSVFLCFTINEFGAGCDNQLTSPLLIAAGTGCTLCKHWNVYDDGAAQDDLCVVFPMAEPPVNGPPIHYVDTDCSATCDITTPTLPSTWGSLKIRYRNP